MKVALAGEALIDFTSVGDLRFQGYCGGSPLNTAIAVARLGQQCGYITQLSTDLFGERLRRHLEDNGVDTRFVLSAYLSGASDVAETIDEWLEDGPVALIVTSGSDGARVFRRGEAPVHARSFQVPIADTIGAGDTFSAATIVALLERGSATPQAVSSLSTPEWTDVLRFAAAAAALNCTRPGADPPTRRELRDFLDSARVPNHAQLASDDLPVRQGRHQRRK